MAASQLSGQAQALLVLLGRRLERSGDEFLKEIGLSASQFEIMRMLWRQDHLTLSELSILCGCAPSNITGLVDRLEKKGLLRRALDSEDRRVARIVLTEEGRKLKAPTGRIIQKYLATFDVFNSQELHTLVSSLEKLYRHLEGEAADVLLERLAE